jgi:hypothetical protein
MPDLRFPKPNREMAERGGAFASEAEGAYHAFSGAVFAEGALGSSTRQMVAVAKFCAVRPVHRGRCEGRLERERGRCTFGQGSGFDGGRRRGMTNMPDIDLVLFCGEGRAPPCARLRAQHDWPRGIGESDPGHDDLKSEDTPDKGLRRWFDHDPESLGAFRRPHRVLASSVTGVFFAQLLGHDPDTVPHESIERGGDVARLWFSTASPMCTTAGELEAMALHAVQGVEQITDVIPAGDRLRRMTDEATVLPTR